MNRRPNQSRSSYDSFSERRAAAFTAVSPDSAFFEKRRRKSFGRQLLRLLLAAFVLLILGNFICDQFVFVERVTVPIRGLTEAFEGYTILQISDLKGALFGGRNQLLLRYALSGAKADAIVLTGDMLSERGNAEPFYALLDALNDLYPNVPRYFIAGDMDPEPVSMDYASGGSPFAPWVLGAKQRGAQMLAEPQSVTRGKQTLWFTTANQLSLDVDAMQGQYEQQYLRALKDKDENELELARYNLQTLEAIRAARKRMTADDVYITLTHALSGDEKLAARTDLFLCGHYLGGLMRLPFVGPLFVPSPQSSTYGILPGADAYSGLSRAGAAKVYISRGLGSSDPRYPAFFFRFFNPPSVTLISLTPSTML